MNLTNEGEITRTPINKLTVTKYTGNVVWVNKRANPPTKNKVRNPKQTNQHQSRIKDRRMVQVCEFCFYYPIGVKDDF